MNDQPKEIVWVRADIAEQLNALEDGAAAEDYILEYAKSLRSDIAVSIEALDDDIVTLRARGIEYKRAFREAFDEEEAAIVSLWEQHQKHSAEAKKHAVEQVNEMRRVIGALNDAYRELQNALDTIKTWQIQETTKTIEGLRVTTESLTPELKETLKSILG